MKTYLSKMIAMLLCISFIFNFCIGGISAEGEQSTNDKYTVIENNSNICTVMTREDGNELYASLDKKTDEITVKVIEKTNKKLLGLELGKDKVTVYSVVIEDFRNGELTAKLIDKETNKEYRVQSKSNIEKVKAQIPVVVGVGVGMAALIEALLAAAAVTLTFATAMTIVDALKKNNPGEPIYFRATCTNPGAEVSMSSYYTLSSARTLLSMGYDFYASNPADAITLCEAVGGVVGPSNDGNPKNAVHYHPVVYISRAHVFFGSDPNLKFIK